ncbi:MAG: chromate transporter [Clostridia bacterium]|nr:chromate transporter [Clostridia bacterium]
MTFLTLFLTFLKIGTFTFGGGYAMLPLIREEVAAHGWLTEQALIDFIAVSESTPGPFAINIATFVGSRVCGVFGAACATLGVVLPSFIIILIVAKAFDRFRESKSVRGCMAGLKPAVVGLIGAALLSLALTVFFPGGFAGSVFTDVSFYFSLAVFALCAVLAFKKLHPVAVIGIAAALGLIGGYVGEWLPVK